MRRTCRFTTRCCTVSAVGDQSAADALMTQATFGFPTTDVWVRACEAAVEQRLRESLPHGRAWQYECDTCHDSGWRPLPDAPPTTAVGARSATATARRTHTRWSVSVPAARTTRRISGTRARADSGADRRRREFERRERQHAMTTNLPAIVDAGEHLACAGPGLQRAADGRGAHAVPRAPARARSRDARSNHHDWRSPVSQRRGYWRAIGGR